MICPSGHRVIDSTGQHWTLREVSPGLYAYHVGGCEELRPKLRVLDLFSGIGGISYGLESTGGFETVAFCEVDPFCREVLAAHWPGVPIHDDVRSLSASAVGRVDAIVGGFPCQPFSVAGKQKAQADERHLWPEFARLIRELRPRWVVAENVPGIRTLAADEVLADLEAAGYSCWPLVVGADDVGAPHRRKRVWFVARLGPADGDSAREPDADQLRGIERDAAGQPAERSGGLLDGEWSASGHDADGRGVWPVGDPTGAGLEGQRADAGEPQEPESWDAGALADREGERRAQQGDGRDAGSRLGCDGARWPARPGEPQHDWEEPRLAYGSGTPQQPVGSPADELPLDMVRLARRGNREALKAAGNSVVPQVVAAIGRAILAADDAQAVPAPSGPVERVLAREEPIP